MKNQKIISSMLAGALVLSMSCPVFAADINANGDSASVPVSLTAEAINFSVTVPTSLPVSVDAQGIVTVADNVKIVNHSYGPVVVTGIKAEAQNDWNLADMSTDMSKEKVGTKKVALSVNNDNIATDGTTTLTDKWTQIDGGDGELAITYDAKIAAQKTALENASVANLIITVAFAE